MLIYILNHLIVSIVHRKKIGQVFSNSAELGLLVKSCRLNGINFMEMYVLKRQMQWMNGQVRRWTTGFLTQERSIPVKGVESSDNAENTRELSKKSNLSLQMEDRAKDEQEVNLRRQYFEKYSFIRSSITIDKVKLAITNLKDFITFDQVFRSSEGKDSNGSGKVKALEPVTKKFLSSRVFKHEDGNFYWASLFLHFNMNVS